MEVEPQMNHISLSKYLTMTKGPPPEMAELQKIEVPQMVQLARPKNSRKCRYFEFYFKMAQLCEKCSTG